jgi:hypothetical protein
MSQQKNDDTSITGGTLINKKLMLSKSEIVQYQLMHYCFMNNLLLNHTELRLLALLGQLGKVRLVEFGHMAVKHNLLSSVQAVNTAMHKLYRTGLYVKEGIGKKQIYLDPKLNIYSEGNIIINLMLCKIDKKTTGHIQANSRKTPAAAGVH